MYKVYCDDVLIYRYGVSQQQNNFMILEPELVLEDNKSGTFTFTMPPDCPVYNTITEMSSRIRIFQNDSIYWVGRPISHTTNFDKTKSYTCEGVLGLLNDILMRPTEEWYINDSILHNVINEYYFNHCDSGNQLHYTNVQELHPTNKYQYYPTNWETCYEIVTSFVEDQKWHIKMDYNASDPYIAEMEIVDTYTQNNSQVIRFGLNLLDYTEDIDMTELATALIPLGAPDANCEFGYVDLKGFEKDSAFWHQFPSTKEGLKAANKYINEHSDYFEHIGYTKENWITPRESALAWIDNNIKTYYPNRDRVYAVGTLPQTYGYIEKVINFRKIKTPQRLYRKVQRYVNKTQFGDVTLNIDAVDLAMLSGSEVSPLEMLDQVRVVAEPFGLDTYFYVSGKTIPLDSPADVKYIFKNIYEDDDE